MPGHLIELYGMLETGFHTYTRFSDDPAKVNGTIGRVVSSMELKILDEAGPGGGARRGRRDRSARPQRASRLPRQRGRQRRGVHRGRLVPHRRPRPCRRRGGQRRDRRAAQGDHQPRRQEVLPARGRGDPLHASQGHARGHGRRRRSRASASATACASSPRPASR